MNARTVGILVFALLAGCGGGGTSGGGGGTAQPLENLYCFGSSSTDALGPNGALLQARDGNFYGTSTGGGIGGGPRDKGFDYYNGKGTVFKIMPTGEETVLHSFAGAPTDGANYDNVVPNALIQGSDGNFYGTTASGGASNYGTVFKLTPEGAETILYSFTGQSDGNAPNALVQGSDGNFYGTTFAGGGNAALGTFFKLTPEGVETVLHSFGVTATDGQVPTGQLLQGSDGNFYGLTQGGGIFPGCGQCATVFKVTPAGAETVLYTFVGTRGDGWNPSALIQGSDGNLYGTTLYGANPSSSPENPGGGIAFKLTPEGVETILHYFTRQSDGAQPNALVQGSDGNFYGTAEGGGGPIGFGAGTIFKLTPTGVVTGLYAFTDDPVGAFDPESQLIQGSDGNLYGTTYLVGSGVVPAGCFYRFVLSAQ